MKIVTSESFVLHARSFIKDILEKTKGTFSIPVNARFEWYLDGEKISARETVTLHLIDSDHHKVKLLVYGSWADPIEFTETIIVKHDAPVIRGVTYLRTDITMPAVAEYVISGGTKPYQVYVTSADPVYNDAAVGSSISINVDRATLTVRKTTIGRSLLLLTVRDVKNQIGTLYVTADVTPVAPRIIQESVPAFYPGSSGVTQYRVQAGTGTPPFSWALLGAPPWLSIRQTTGTMFWEHAVFPPSLHREASVMVMDALALTGTYPLYLGVPADVVPPYIWVPDFYLLGGKVGTPFSKQMAVVPGTGYGDLRWSMKAAPVGLSINETTGRITGSPEESGSFMPEVTVIDAAGNKDTHFILCRILPGEASSLSFELVGGHNGHLHVGSGASFRNTTENTSGLSNWVWRLTYPDNSVEVGSGAISYAPIGTKTGTVLVTLEATLAGSTVQCQDYFNFTRPPVFKTWAAGDEREPGGNVTIGSSAPVGYALIESGTGTAPFTSSVSVSPTGPAVTSTEINTGSNVKFAVNFTALSGLVTPGTYTVTLTATDALGDSVSKSYSYTAAFASVDARILLSTAEAPPHYSVAFENPPGGMMGSMILKIRVDKGYACTALTIKGQLQELPSTGFQTFQKSYAVIPGMPTVGDVNVTVEQRYLLWEGDPAEENYLSSEGFSQPWFDGVASIPPNDAPPITLNQTGAPQGGVFIMWAAMPGNYVGRVTAIETDYPPIPAVSRDIAFTVCSQSPHLVR